MCNEDKTVLRHGDTLKFSKLAETMETVAELGADAFYTGKIGKDLIEDIHEQGWSGLQGGIDGKSKWAKNCTLKDKQAVFIFRMVLLGGTLTMEDLKSFEVQVQDAWTVPLGKTVMHIPPPPAGGAMLGFVLRLMKGFESCFSDKLNWTESTSSIYTFTVNDNE